MIRYHSDKQAILFAVVFMAFAALFVLNIDPIGYSVLELNDVNSIAQNNSITLNYSDTIYLDLHSREYSNGSFMISGNASMLLVDILDDNNLEIENITVNQSVLYLNNFTDDLNQYLENCGTAICNVPIKLEFNGTITFSEFKLYYSNESLIENKSINVINKSINNKLSNKTISENLTKEDDSKRLGNKLKNKEIKDKITINSKIRKDKKYNINITKDNNTNQKTKVRIKGANFELIKSSIISKTDKKISTEIFAADNIEFETAEVTLKKTGTVDRIITCDNFDIDKELCISGWRNANIDFIETSDTIIFNVTHFSGYAGAPNVTYIHLNATSPNNYTTDNLTLQYETYDAEGDDVNVSINWFRNDEQYLEPIVEDDFEDGTINTTLWNLFAPSDTSITEENGYLKYSKTSNYWGGSIVTKDIFNNTNGFNISYNWKASGSETNCGGTNDCGGRGLWIYPHDTQRATSGYWVDYNGFDSSDTLSMRNRHSSGNYEAALSYFGTWQSNTISSWNTNWHKQNIIIYENGTIDYYIDGTLQIRHSRNDFIENFVFDFYNGAYQVSNYYIDNISIKPLNSADEIITNKKTQIGDEWYACVTPNDGNQSGATVCSNTITINEEINNPPSITSLKLNATSPNNYTTDNLTLQYETYDAEGDDVNVSISWFRNDKIYSGSIIKEKFNDSSINTTLWNLFAPSDTSITEENGYLKYSKISNYWGGSIVTKDIFNNTNGFNISYNWKASGSETNCGGTNDCGGRGLWIYPHDTQRATSGYWVDYNGFDSSDTLSMRNRHSSGNYEAALSYFGTWQSNTISSWNTNWHKQNIIIYKNGTVDYYIDGTLQIRHSRNDFVENFVFDFYNGAYQVSNYYIDNISIETLNYENGTITNTKTQIGDEWYVCITPSDGIQNGTTLCSNTITINEEPLIQYNEFSTEHGSTNLSNVTDINNVYNLTLATQNGKIKFSKDYAINAENEDYDSNIEIGNRFLSVNTSALDETFNNTANITISTSKCPKIIYYSNEFYNSAQDIIDENNICNSSSSPYCTNIVCSNNLLTFTTEHFTGFAVKDDSNLTIWDQNDSGMPYSELNAYSNQKIMFYSNHTNSSGIINNSNCSIWFNDTQIWNNMTYNETIELYEYNRTFDTIGTYSWNVSCENIVYETIEANDTIIISESNNAPSKVTLLLPLEQSTTGNRTPKLTWQNSTDIQNDNLTYQLLVSNVSDFNNIIFNITNISEQEDNTSWEVNETLNFTTYFWKVRAYDNISYGEYSDTWNFTVEPSVIISLPINSISFDNLSEKLEIKNTTDGTYNPLKVQNDGNTLVDITINATDLWNSQENPSEYYQYKIRENESESFNISQSTTIWTFIKSINALIDIAQLKWQDTNDTAFIDIFVKVPIDERAGEKQSTITLFAEESDNS